MKKLLISLLLLNSLTAIAAPTQEDLPVACGLEGSLQERINDCSYEKSGFSLVMRDFREGHSKDAHMDNKTKRIWGPPVGNYNWYDTKEICESEQFHEYMGLEDVTWRMPTIRDFMLSHKNGMRKGIEFINYGMFWSSTYPEEYRPVRFTMDDVAVLYIGYSRAPFELDYFSAKKYPFYQDIYNKRPKIFGICIADID